MRLPPSFPEEQQEALNELHSKESTGLDGKTPMSEINADMEDAIEKKL